MMRRDHCFRILARHIRDEIVVPVYQAAQEWRAARPDHALTYYSIGAMGQASSCALGLAIGHPDKRVIVLDGDGSLLMNLGTLVTIAGFIPIGLNSSNAGEFTNARAMATRCCSPPESSPARWLFFAASPTRSS